RPRVCATPLSLSCLPSLPSPPPFPYTTLFRSDAQALADMGAPVDTKAFCDSAYVLGILEGRMEGSLAGASWRAARDGYARHVEGDRKSTRLNSSHVSISYAVFCLKKKNRGSQP